MSDAHKVDICVIGAGAAGLTVAAGASQLGASVLLVERGEMGGECLNTGCVPSKALLAAAARGDGFEAAFAHLRRTIAEIAPQDSQERFEGLGVRVLRETARFTGPDTLDVGGATVRARRFVVATGSVPALPPIPGLDSTPYLTNETLFTADLAPDHLVILGGGPIGVEMAQAFRRLGARVTVIEQGRILGRDDPELTAFVRESLAADGVTLREATEVRSVASAPGGVSVSCAGSGGGTGGGTGDTETITGTHLLVAAGRAPNVGDLDLARARVRMDGPTIAVDGGLRTSNRRIYAIGDVVGPYRFTHMAGYQARLVLRSALFRLPAKARYAAVPWVTYTDPELAHVGLSEAEATARGETIRVLRASFAENDRAIAEGAGDGLIKVVVTPRGRVRGASIVGPQAGELILPWVMAVQRGLKVSALAQAIVPYPTLSEVSARAAGSYYLPMLFSERTRRIVRFLARFG